VCACLSKEQLIAWYLVLPTLREDLVVAGRETKGIMWWISDTMQQDEIFFDKGVEDLYNLVVPLDVQLSFRISENLNKAKKRALQKKYRQSDNYKAYCQSDKYKESRRKYYQSEKFKESRRKYQQSEKFKESRRKYQQSDNYKAYQQSEKYKASKKAYYQRRKQRSNISTGE